jgi:hypothetical protein
MHNVSLLLPSALTLCQARHASSTIDTDTRVYIFIYMLSRGCREIFSTAFYEIFEVRSFPQPASATMSTVSCFDFRVACYTFLF